MTFCESDSETHTSDNQLARRIQSKSVRGLGMDPPVGVWGAKKKMYDPILMTFVSAYASDDLKTWKFPYFFLNYFFY